MSILHSVPALEPKMEADRMARPPYHLEVKWMGAETQRPMIRWRHSLEIIAVALDISQCYMQRTSGRQTRCTVRINCSILLVSIFSHNYCYRPEFPNKVCAPQNARVPWRESKVCASRTQGFRNFVDWPLDFADFWSGYQNVWIS